MRDSIADFPMGKSYGCSQFLNWLLQLSTGQLHLDGFESLKIRWQKIKAPGWVLLFFGRG